MKPTLLILAAGMGSRYGGLKQLDSVGPSGETIIDYSIYDAIKVGFGKLVYLIRKDIEEDFKARFANKCADQVEIGFAIQDYGLAERFPFVAERRKPWGTAHAVLAAKDQIDGPFAVINSDDFYGASSYQSAIDFLKQIPAAVNGEQSYAFVGYKLENTLSDVGPVSRGIGVEDENENLIAMNERHGIERCADGIYYTAEQGGKVRIESNCVSMNFFAFTPRIFAELATQFSEFVSVHGQNPESEFLIPQAVDRMIRTGLANVKVLKTDARCYGLTYQNDRPRVVAALKQLVDEGVYPSPLW